MSEGDERGGTGPRGRRPSRRMRERADEMAGLLAHAAPAVRARRRRRNAAIPAAVVALGALTVGGVGVAVGLDNEPASNTTAPSPSAPLEGEPSPGSSPSRDVPLGETLAGERTDAVERVDATDTPEASRDGSDTPHAAAGPRLRPAPLAPRASSTTTTTGRGDGDDRDEETPRSTTSTSQRPDDEDTDEPRPSRTRPRSDAPTERSAGPGAGDRQGRADLRADSRGPGTVLPSRAPTGDGE